MATFMEMMEAQWAQGKHLCIGLDPDFLKIPDSLKRFRGRDMDIDEIFDDFCRTIVMQTRHIAAAYKPNTAFFERYRSDGFRALQAVISFAREKAPDVPIILDAKRGDIGNTNEHYAVMAFDSLGADAITIHPYLGCEANKPFLDRADKGIFVLCRTSNPDADEFQNLEVSSKGIIRDLIPGHDIHARILRYTNNSMPLYQYIAASVASVWNTNGNCGLVTGATYPEDIYQVRQLAPEVPLLIPGVGTQGGDLEASVKAARHRFLINSSSGIIFADDPKQKAEELDGQIRHVLTLIEERKER